VLHQDRPRHRHVLLDDLLLRAADVTLKERRRLVLVVRETPLHRGHLRLLTQVTEMGAVVMPPVPAFYHYPRDLADVIDQTVNRALDLLDIELRFPRGEVFRWRMKELTFFDCYTNGRPEDFDQCVAPDYTDYGHTPPGIGPGGARAALKGLSLYNAAGGLLRSTRHATIGDLPQ
jgi:hypothetical protein